METANAVKVYIHAPCEALRPFVKRFLVIEFSSAHEDSHLPDMGLVAAFHYKGDLALDGGIKAPQAAITGLWDTSRLFKRGALSVRFRLSRHMALAIAETPRRGGSCVGATAKR